jgi:hypothetical protein
MAYTRLTDIFEPAIWIEYGQEHTPQKFDLIESGILVTPPESVMAQLGSGGTRFDMPFWQDISRTEPGIPSDDETVKATPAKVTSAKMRASKHYNQQWWEWTRLAGQFATGRSDDPAKVVLQGIEDFWRNDLLTRVIKSLDGIRGDNVTNDSGDMRYSVYSDVASGSITAAMKISDAATVAARLTMGEFMNDDLIYVMHSKVYADARMQEAITFVQPSGLPYQIAMFGGGKVIVSDSCTVTSGTNSPMYRTYMLGRGSIYSGRYTNSDDAETWKDPLAGNGRGVEYLGSRRTRLIHPNGFDFTESSMASHCPTWAELATTANWDRKQNRKNIKIAFLETN